MTSLKIERLEEVHNSLVNGQRQQMVEQIEAYGIFTFWDDYNAWLGLMSGVSLSAQYTAFADVTISYWRNKARR